MLWINVLLQGDKIFCKHRIRLSFWWALHQALVTIYWTWSSTKINKIKIFNFTKRPFYWICVRVCKCCVFHFPSPSRRKESTILWFMVHSSSYCFVQCTWLNGSNTHFISVRFNIHRPLMSMSILLSLLSKITSNISKDDWLNYCNTLQKRNIKKFFFFNLNASWILGKPSEKNALKGKIFQYQITVDN